MGLTGAQTIHIEESLKSSIRDKFQNYNPKPTFLPFHTRLLGQDRLPLYKFIQSLNTSFWATIFEPVAVVAAEENIDLVEKELTKNC